MTTEIYQPHKPKLIDELEVARERAESAEAELDWLEDVKLMLEIFKHGSYMLRWVRRDIVHSLAEDGYIVQVDGPRYEYKLTTKGEAELAKYDWEGIE